MRLSVRWKKFKAWFVDHHHQGIAALALIGPVLLALLVRLLWPMMIPQPQPMVPLLVNGGFEGDTSHDTIYWTLTGGPFYTEFNEIEGPEGWTTWWREGFLCSGTDDWRTGRPEVRVISGPDRERIHSGKQAAQWFTFWRCHEGGLLQQVPVEPGHYYTLKAYAHSWFSRCSHRPHDPPYDADCKTPIDWAQDWLSVGIDPTEGIDPMASTVVWGIEAQIYGRYASPLTTGRVQARGETLTVFVRSEASHPLKHVDFYIDDAVLRDVTYQIFLPIVARGQ